MIVPECGSLRDYGPPLLRLRGGILSTALRTDGSSARDADLIKDGGELCDLGWCRRDQTLSPNDADVSSLEAVVGDPNAQQEKGQEEEGTDDEQ